jgi:hypothetical protein
MKRTYESFDELAEAMTKGEGLLHMFNCHAEKDPFYKDHCCAWQSGIRDFAEWLDHIGVKAGITDGAENFYEFTAKKYKECDKSN